MCIPFLPGKTLKRRKISAVGQQFTIVAENLATYVGLQIPSPSFTTQVALDLWGSVFYSVQWEQTTVPIK